MKCKSFVKFIPARKKGSGAPYQKAVKIYPRYYISLGRFTPEPDMVECDGDIEVNIDAELEGDCACSSYAVLNIKYKCKKCGANIFPELPQDSKELSYFVQLFLSDDFTEDERDKMLDNKIFKERQHQKEIDKMHEERKIRDEKNYNEMKILKSKKKKK